MKRLTKALAELAISGLWAALLLLVLGAFFGVWA